MIFFQYLANGLILGGLYACIAAGFSLVWGVLSIINLLHGSFIVLGFYIAFAGIRALTHAIRAGRGPFHDVAMHGRHIHHLVWGIVLLLAVGYAWLAQVGLGTSRSSIVGSRITAILYGIGAALTLDEFALWLRLEDVYWSREGRESVEAVLLFGGLLSVGLWGGRFLQGLVRATARVLRRR